MHSILFVCTGNVCRSPMAAACFNAIARRAGESDQYTACSAGTWALDNEPASKLAVKVMAERQIDLTQHRGRTVTPELIEQSAAVIVMTHNHHEALAAEFPLHRTKMHLMSELGNRSFDIADPYGGTLEEYQNCAKELEELLDQGYERIKSWISNTPTDPS
jgi:protein-tyrosine-phosphatase